MILLLSPSTRGPSNLRFATLLWASRHKSEVSGIMTVPSFHTDIKHGRPLSRRISFTVILAYASTAAWAQTAARKKTVAVLDFNNAAVQTGINNSYLRTDAPALGRGVS